MRTANLRERMVRNRSIEYDGINRFSNFNPRIVFVYNGKHFYFVRNYSVNIDCDKIVGMRSAVINRFSLIEFLINVKLIFIRQQELFNVLKAYTIYNPKAGYCQAQAPVAAFLLMHMPAVQAFWCLVRISDNYLENYYSPSMEVVQRDGLIDQSKFSYLNRLITLFIYCYKVGYVNVNASISTKI